MGGDKCTTIKFLVGAGVSAIIAYTWMRMKEKARPKGEWKQIGTVESLYIYPLKSSKGKALNEAETTEKGLREIRTDGLLPLGDRVFVAYNAANHDFVTGRTYHNFLGISVESLSSDTVRFSYNGVEDLNIKVPTEFSDEEVRMWDGEKVPTVDCGEEASLWITKVLGAANPLRMGYWAQSITGRRDIIKFHKEKADFYKIENEDSGAYSDLSSFLLINQSSVEDLNSRLSGSKSVSHKHFRPNILISGPAPFEEDESKWIKIGDKAVFRNFKPCTRCIFTTIDPETMIRDRQMEPLKTLKKYRTATEEKQKKLEGTSPFMGLNLSIYQLGNIAIGDPVYFSD